MASAPTVVDEREQSPERLNPRAFEAGRKAGAEEAKKPGFLDKLCDDINAKVAQMDEQARKKAELKVDQKVTVNDVQLGVETADRVTAGRARAYEIAQRGGIVNKIRAGLMTRQQRKELASLSPAARLSAREVFMTAALLEDIEFDLERDLARLDQEGISAMVGVVAVTGETGIVFAAVTSPE